MAIIKSPSTRRMFGLSMAMHVQSASVHVHISIHLRIVKYVGA